jgi:hypothetical protein
MIEKSGFDSRTGKNIYLPLGLQIGCAVHTTYYLMGTGSTFYWCKVAGA